MDVAQRPVPPMSMRVAMGLVDVAFGYVGALALRLAGVVGRQDAAPRSMFVTLELG